MNAIVKTALLLSVVLIGLAFHLRNGQLVVIDYYLGQVEIPLSLALAVTLLVGALAGVLSGLPRYLRLKRDKAKLAGRLKAGETANRPEARLPPADKET